MKQILFSFLLLSSLGLAAGSYYEVTGVADNDTLTVRHSASASSKKVGELMSYDTAIVLKRCKNRGGSTWCQVDFLPDDVMFFERGGNFGNGTWVNKKYLKPAHNILFSYGIEYNQNHNIFRVVGVRANDTLNVRQHPRNTAKKIGHLQHNDFGIVAAKCQKVKGSAWCYVAYDYTMGWASGPGSTKVLYALLGWVNMRYLKLDATIKNRRLPGMTFPGEAF